jgi:hypothetical protein
MGTARPVNRPVSLVAVLALAGGLLTGCGDDDTSTEAAAASTTTTVLDEPKVVTVTALDYAYEGLPTSVAAGTQFRLESGSDDEIHELVAFRLPDEESRPVGELVTLPPEELLPALGGEPTTVLLVPPGGDMIPAVGDGTLSEPGRYAIVCIIPTGADPAEYLEKAATSNGPPDVAGGPPHISHGMFAELTVE